MSTKLFSPILLAPFLFGCGAGEPAVSGSVTVDGHPLQNGYITFFPTEGTKNTAGAKVVDGRYRIEQIPAGPRRVMISGMPEASASSSGGNSPTLKFSPSANRVSSQATGNQQVVQIQPGTQRLDFVLANPKAAPTR